MITFVVMIQREIGKWFMDIAKYVATIGILATILGDMSSKTAFYVGGTVLTLFFLAVGILFIRKSNNQDKN